MSTARQHLQDLHEHAGDYHAARAAHHLEMAKHFDALAGHLQKADLSDGGDEAMDVLHQISAEHQAQAERDVAQGEFHAKCMAALKAAGGDFEKLAPLREGLHAFPLEFQDATRPNIRAVIRPGQPELGKGSGVPADFEELLKIDF